MVNFISCGNQPEDSRSFNSLSFEKIDHNVIERQTQALESLLNEAKTLSCKNSLERLISFLSGEGTTDFSHLNEAYKNFIQSLDKEPELDRSLVCEALGFNKEQAELNDASDLTDLINRQIAGFSKEKLLEMCTLSKISYGDKDIKLAKDGYKTKEQFGEDYKIIKFYDNESIEDEYRPDDNCKLEQRNVGYVLKGSNLCARDAGYVFIKDREINIAYHGTRDLNDVKEDLRASLAELSFLPEGNYVHSGFHSLFKRSWPSVHKILQGHANDQELAIKDLKINITGHSMGGALATIAALCLNETEKAEDVHVATFGSPRVLYNNAAEIYDKRLGTKTIRVACQSDPVPCLPHGNAGMHYKHVGKPLKLETGKTLDYLELHYHKLNVYSDLIKDIGEKGFTSKDSTSKYFPIAYVCGLLYHAVLSYSTIDDKKFFEEVREENKDIKLSKIPLYILKLEEELKQEERGRNELNGQVAQLKEKCNTTKTQLTEREKELGVANEKVLQLEQETSNQQASIDDLTKMTQLVKKDVPLLKAAIEENTQLKNELESTRKTLNDTEQALDNANQNISQLKAELKEQEDQLAEERKLKQELDKKINEVSRLTKEFENKNKELGIANQALNTKIQTLESTQAQLKQESDSAKQELDEKTNQVTQLQEKLEKTKIEFAKKEEKLESKTGEVTKLNDTIEGLKKINAGLEGKNSNLTNQLEKLQKEEELSGMQQSLKCPNLGNENKKLSAVSAQSRKQVTYASVSFVLSGALAVGASLIMFHLAICIALAVAALTFLAVGCYCSYKANTALSNVEVDQVSRDEEMVTGYQQGL